MKVTVSAFFYKGYFDTIYMDVNEDIKNSPISFARDIKKLFEEDTEKGDLRLIIIRTFFDDIQKIEIEFI